MAHGQGPNHSAPFLPLQSALRQRGRPWRAVLVLIDDPVCLLLHYFQYTTGSRTKIPSLVAMFLSMFRSPCFFGPRFLLLSVLVIHTPVPTSLKQNPSFSPALSSESSPHEYLPSLTLGVPHSNYKLQTISQPPSLRQRSLAVFAMFVSLRGISVQTTVLSLVNVPPALYFASSQTTRATRELTSLQLRQRPRHQYARSTGHHPLLDYTLLDGSRGVFDIR